MPKPFNLFVYGTLMNPSVFRAVMGRRLVLPEEAKVCYCVDCSEGGSTAEDHPVASSPSMDYVVAHEAVLHGYRKISPDNTYMYAVPDRQGRISGYVIGPLPGECMAGLRKYEGRNYSRKTVCVHTGEGFLEKVQAVAFVGNLRRVFWSGAPRSKAKPGPELQELTHSFGYPFRDPLKQEVLLRNKIEAVLLEAEQELPISNFKLEVSNAESVARRSLGELHGKTIRDLVRQHFDAGGISDYVIRQSLLFDHEIETGSVPSAGFLEPSSMPVGQCAAGCPVVNKLSPKKSSRLPDYTRIIGDFEAQKLARYYLTMVVRQVIFNQMEEKVRQDFRYELDQMQGVEFYDRAISSLAALRMINSSKPLMDMLCTDCLTSLGTSMGVSPVPKTDVMDARPANTAHLVDFVRWAVAAADAIYETAWARHEINDIKAHMGQGVIPLGAELEFSNIGNEVIHDPQGANLRDLKYDSFLYFADFGLDVLTWKLGGHIDDHHEKTSAAPRRGFFETALGSLSLEPNLSKPITASPWMLSQLVLETAKFYDIRPHSLHISMQLRSQHRPGAGRLLPLYAMKCLFALAGDPGFDEAGQFVIRRLAGDEIVHRDCPGSMLFCEISRRHSSETGDGLATRGPGASGRFVQQFKFLRLSTEIDYEAIIVGLKGLQLSLRPGSFLTPSQYKNSPKHRRMFDELLAWGQNPAPISDPEVTAFLGHVYDGLINERHGKAVHTEEYIACMMDKLRRMIGDFNRQAASVSAPGRRRGAAAP